MIRKLRRSAGKVLAAWSRIRRSVEGPELEPRFWHSHFLSYRTSDPILKRVGHHLRGLVLDIGSGTGHGARYLERDHTSYFPTDLPTGRDPNDRMISRQAISPKVYGSVYTLPFGENCFDGALLLSVLAHLSDPLLALEELRRVLKPGALVLVAAPFAFPLHGTPADYRRWTIPGLEVELKNAGYEVLEALPCGGVLTSLAMNLHLAIRYHWPATSLMTSIIVQVVLPLFFVFQGLSNLLALLLDKFDHSDAFPLSIAVLARKPFADTKIPSDHSHYGQSAGCTRPYRE